ncbi:D-amino acid dehydrogenase small subunit [Rubripirellula tenax]|uniref:D-amino acid dehydrogenase small subunit n=1 Tax=Rubripirellula tenax TaxID=2528015 RepID=A0A5C6ECE7_9BACT|nr:FAD-dependent oxidoreductase [Rubripirellula tenax]TWU46350.1 D-amino acid dehydrogenase small subunit [Rubripirellula tenax]
MSKRIVIIGGGVIGLSTAWHCHASGHQVTVIDRGPSHRGGCSFGNAGMIVPSHMIPLAAPGMIRMGLKWMASPESPFYIRPRLSMELASWLWKFKTACTQQHVDRSAPLLRDLHLASRAGYEALQSELPDGFDFSPTGLMMLCKKNKSFHEECETAKFAERLGVPVKVLSAPEAAELDPSITMDISGAVYYPKDCHLSPNRLMSAMENRLAAQNVDFRWDCEVTDFAYSASPVSNQIERVLTNLGEFDADEIILCGGVWSSAMGIRLGIELPMQAGKGYSVTLQNPVERPSICSILTEARVAVTPMGEAVRFGGTMEIAGLDESISTSRVRGILKSIPDYFPKFAVSDFRDCKPWVGLRPCSPDGMPYLGRPRRLQNVIVSTGHAMMGISLAMVSGELVAEMVDGKPASIEGLELLSPDRYGRRS